MRLQSGLIDCETRPNSLQPNDDGIATPLFNPAKTCMIATFPCLSLEKQKIELEPLIESLKKSSFIEKKIELITQFKQVAQEFDTLTKQYPFIARASSEGILCIKSLLAIDQGHLFSQEKGDFEENQAPFNLLLEQLLPIETFYQEIGGLIGYHYAVISLILEQKNPPEISPSRSYHHPKGYDFSRKNDRTWEAIKWGIEGLPSMAHIYPVGGAGDRLNLIDETTQEPLPAAQLLFCGRTLLEGLLRDLQAKEYLYYKLYGKQLTTPVAMMTSHEKNNHQHICQICEQNRWFHRSRKNFFLFIQPLVPVITQEGQWLLKNPFSLLLKPGGHGVIWKLAKDYGLFEWFNKKQRRYALIRQINNPLAGTDDTLLAFMGIGGHENKVFGFASCPRYLNTSEGMNVVVEDRIQDSYRYCITNIEYTEFKKHSLRDMPCEEGSLFSAFPANTNILFANLEKIEKAIENYPLPGKLINMKACVSIERPEGTKEIPAGRLETTMQNIADEIFDCFAAPLEAKDYTLLKTYLTYHKRLKTISVTKHSLFPEGSIAETPEKCFYDLMQNMHELLNSACHIEMPGIPAEEDYLKTGPTFIALLHPALGPLYSITAQKIQNGKITNQSELILEIAEVRIENLELHGSLKIWAERILGHLDQEEVLHYSEQNGKCILKNVTVINKGIDFSQKNIFWKQEVYHLESLQINIHGSGEFIAENVAFIGPTIIEVPDGHRVRAYYKNGQIAYEVTKIESPSWHWSYSWDSRQQIKLTQIFS
ncbi:UTP--glucose-1-phosphate uridylyltransferase [Parachlamydia sp. AcF125]|uniref:UTP--glucose-1-phosphate uridylyltransferase n=1 Tax=Parachlamydia sp. AcF125 TaxID=2795736 RepID=UPI001BC9A292|nr:UTP--glucose-1-phosphate uridylyltransferase [Parachlamydia sp. AcF125]MBS4167897.1 hypothetical protein [Parachlamydia sp. AcF125]